MTVATAQRFTQSRPCPVCGRYDQAPRGQGVRCFGFLSDDGRWAHCSRQEHAGPIELKSNTQTYAHILTGNCNCGVQHGQATSSPSVTSHSNGRKIVATYDYQNQTGTPLFQVVRYHPKDFVQRRPDGNGGLVYNLKGVPRPLPLYRLPQLLASEIEAPVYLVEGEEDANKLCSLGLVATTTVMGAGKASITDLTPLQGRHIVPLPDNDDPGRHHVQDVAQRLQGLAASVRIVELPGLPEHGDVSDWLGQGHTVAELHELATSAPEWEPGPSDEGQAPVLDGVRVVCLADVESETVTWVWYPYLPLGKVTLLEGDPGVGKSHVALAIATAVSLGLGLPGAPPADLGNVLIMSAEDGLGDTIRPRLDRMGADVARIVAIDGPVTFDAEGLEFVDHHLFLVKPRLLIIDPVVAYLGANLDLHRANELRAVTSRLAALAERHGCAILAIRHLTKSSMGKAIYRGLGSIDLTAAARSVLLAGADPDAPHIRAIVPIKSNLAPMGDAVGYTIDQEHGYLWAGESALTAGRILAPEGKEEAETLLEQAQDFLREALSVGSVEAQDIQRQAMAIGIKKRTLERAKAALGVQANAIRELGKPGVRGWTLTLGTVPKEPREGLDRQESIHGNVGDVTPRGYLKPPASLTPIGDVTPPGGDTLAVD